MNWLKTKGAALLLSLMLVWTLAVPAAAATAATMQLTKTQGTVSVANASGRSLSLMDNMRLYTGYTVETKASSYAWISLDSSKLAKLDAASKAEIRKSGSKLEVLLKSGNIFFNVSQPLSSTETLNVRTSTAIVGIRGTCGWVNMTNADTVEVYILEGTVECTVTNPSTGEARTVTVNSGEMVELLVHSEQTGDTCEANVTAFNEDDVQGFVLVDVLEDDALCDKILEYSGLDFQTGDLDAQGRLAADEAETNQLLEEAERGQSEQESNASSDPLWDAAPAPDPTPNTPQLIPNPAPSTAPSAEPSAAPSIEPSAEPSEEPSAEPSVEPSEEPSADPSVEPSDTLEDPDPEASIPSEGADDPGTTGGPGEAGPEAAAQSIYSDPLTDPGPDAILPDPAESGDGELEEEMP